MASTRRETLATTARREGTLTAVVTRLTTVVAVVTASSLVAVGVDVVAVRLTAAAGAPGAGTLVGAVVGSTRIVGARIVRRVGPGGLLVGNEAVLGGHSSSLGYGILNVDGAGVNGAHRAQVNASAGSRRRVVSSGSLLVWGLLRGVGGRLLGRMGVASGGHRRLGRSRKARLALSRGRGGRTLSRI